MRAKTQTTILRYIVDDEDYFSCGNCWEMQYGNCKGNAEAKPCRNYASRDPTCSSCLSFGFLDYRPGIPHCLFHLKETEADKPFCDDWRPKLGIL